MFKRLKERLVEEANKLPVTQHAFSNSGKSPDGSSNKFPACAAKENAEDFVISESPSIIVPHSSSDNFSIADEEGFLSDPNSPQKKMTYSSAGSELHSTTTLPGSKSSADVYHSNVVPSQSSFIPTTDIESEVEEPPTLNLEDISKEQLLTAICTLKARLCKYKNKYSEVVLAYKCNNEEKRKLEHTLTENQDRTLRRMAELREQYQLEQKAKADLEGNLRMDLDEKESKISALKTQITLLKEGQSDNDSLENAKQYTTASSMTDVIYIIDYSSSTVESSRIQEYEAIIATKTEELDRISKENTILAENLRIVTKTSEEYEAIIATKTEELDRISKENTILAENLRIVTKTSEEKVNKLHSEHEMTVKLMKARLEDLTCQQESSDMSMAEIKQNMHKELELKEDQMKKMKEEINQLQIAIHHKAASNNDMKIQYEAKIKELQVHLETMERTMEEDKQLHISVSRKKSDAVVLIQKEHEKKVAAIEKEWSQKYQELQLQNENAKQEQAKNEAEFLAKIAQEKAQCFSLQQRLKGKYFEVDEPRVQKLKFGGIFTTEEIEEKIRDTKFKAEEEGKKRIESLDIQISDLKKQIFDMKKQMFDMKKHIFELKQDGSENDYNGDENYNMQLTQLNHDEKVHELEEQIMLLEKARRDEVQMLSNVVQQFKGVEFDDNIKDGVETSEYKQIIEELNSQIQQLQHQNKDMETVIAEILKTNNELGILKIDYEKQIENLKNQPSKLKDEEFQAMKEKVKYLFLECCNYRESLDMLKEQVQSLQETRDSEVISFNNSIEQLKQQTEKCKSEEKEKFQACEFQYKTTIEQLNVKIQQFQDKNLELEINKTEILQRNKEFVAVIADYEKQIKKFHIQISELKEQIKKLEDLNFQNISELSEKEAKLISELKVKDGEFQAMLKDKENMLSLQSDEYKASLETLNKTIISLEQSRDFEVTKLNEAVKLLEQENCQLKVEKKEKDESCESYCKLTIDQQNAKILQLQDCIEKMEEVKQKCNEMNENVLFALEAILNRCQSSDLTPKDSYIAENIKFLNTANDDKDLDGSPSHFVEKGLKLLNQDYLGKDLSEKEKAKCESQEMSKNILLSLEAILHHFHDFNFVPENAYLDEKGNKLLNMADNQGNHIEESQSDLDDGSLMVNTELSKAIEHSDLNEKVTLQTESEDLQKLLKDFDGEEMLPEIQSMQKTIQLLKEEAQFYKEKSILNESAYNNLQNEYEQRCLAQQKDMQNLLSDMQMELAAKEDEDLIERLKKNELEIAALRLDICEKDRALEEIREHYELIIREKDAVVMELKSHSVNQSNVITVENDAVSSEPSDWDDTWVVPEETCENVLPISGDEAVCDEHLKEIETLKEELDKCNSEIKDLKILLHLSPPQPIESEHHYFTGRRSLPESTEMEYLKNILFQYMMGTETEILAKVIAAVLKFSENQTKMIIDKEKAKSIQK